MAILVFGAIIVYLCGRRGGFNEAKQRGLCSLSPHNNHPYTTKLKDEELDGDEYSKRRRNSSTASSGINSNMKSQWKRLFSRRSNKAQSKRQQPSIISPLQIQVHPGNNTHANTLEFQAAVQNLLGFTEEGVHELYP